MKRPHKHLWLVPPDHSKQIQDLERRLAGRSLSEYVATRYPDLATNLPPDVTAQQFAHAEGFARYANEALSVCARCPEHGGACDDGQDNDRLIPKGNVPVWDPETTALTTVPCGKWNDHALRRRLERSLVPRDLLGCRLDTYIPGTKQQREALKACENFVETFDPRIRSQSGLFLFSKKHGVGKTHLALAVLAELLRTRRVRSALYWFVPELLESVRKAFDDYDRYGQIIEQVKSADLLILDDLGAQNPSAWVKEQITIVANKRWSEGRCTIVTTNEPVDVMELSLGKRAVSRILSKLTGVVLNGKDHRDRTN